MFQESMQQVAISAIKNLYNIESYLSNDPVLRNIWPDYDKTLEEFPNYRKALVKILLDAGYSREIVLRPEKFNSLFEIKDTYTEIISTLQNFAFENKHETNHLKALDEMMFIGGLVFDRYVSFLRKFGKVFYPKEERKSK